MKNIVPALKYPTSVVFVDDQKDFLDVLSDYFFDKQYCKYYCDPLEASDFIIKNIIKTPFEERVIKLANPDKIEERKISVNLDLIKDEMKFPLKSQQISVVVVDYEMPTLNGLSFCKLISNPNVYKILLTGKADDKLIIDAFNNGVIDVYIPKLSPNLLSDLHKQIKIGQDHYFLNYTGLTNSIILMDTESKSYVNTPQFINFFNKLISEKDIEEFYLIEPIGSFIMKSKLGKVSKLYLADSTSLQSMIEQLPDGMDSQVIDDIKQGIKMFCFNEMNEQGISVLAEQYIYPSSKIVGEYNLYYAYIG
jgi:CheY-like chemotaxis protein